MIQCVHVINYKEAAPTIGPISQSGQSAQSALIKGFRAAFPFERCRTIGAHLGLDFGCALHLSLLTRNKFSLYIYLSHPKRRPPHNPSWKFSSRMPLDLHLAIFAFCQEKPQYNHIDTHMSWRHNYGCECIEPLLYRYTWYEWSKGEY